MAMSTFPGRSGFAVDRHFASVLVNLIEDELDEMCFNPKKTILKSPPTTHPHMVGLLLGLPHYMPGPHRGGSFENRRCR